MSSASDGGGCPALCFAPTPNTPDSPQAGTQSAVLGAAAAGVGFCPRDSPEVCFAAQALCGYAHACCPFGFLYAGRVSPHSGSFAALSVSSPPSGADVAVLDAS